MSERPITCGGCGQPVPNDTAEESRVPCRGCGSTARAIGVGVAHTLEFTDGHRARGFGTKPTGGKKPLFDVTGGHEMSRKLGRPVRKTRVIDHRKDQYTERVEDPKTGEVLRDISEPLKEHIDRGSAKEPKPEREP